MLTDQTLCLFTQCTHKNSAFISAGEEESLPSLGKVKLEKIINHETIRRLAG